MLIGTVAVTYFGLGICHEQELLPAYILSAFNVVLIAVSVGLSLYTFIVVPIFFLVTHFLR